MPGLKWVSEFIGIGHDGSLNPSQLKMVRKVRIPTGTCRLTEDVPNSQ